MACLAPSGCAARSAPAVGGRNPRLGRRQRDALPRITESRAVPQRSTAVGRIAAVACLPNRWAPSSTRGVSVDAAKCRLKRRVCADASASDDDTPGSSSKENDDGSPGAPPKPSDSKKRPGKNRDVNKESGKKRRKAGDKNASRQRDPDAEKTWEAIKRSEPALKLLKEQAARSRDVCIVCGDKTQSCGGLQNIRGRIRNRPGDCKKASPYEKTRPFAIWRYLLERARGNDPGNLKKPKKNGARR